MWARRIGWCLAVAALAPCLSDAACLEDTTPWTHRLPLRDDVIHQDVLKALSHELDLVAIRPGFERVSFSVSATTLNSTFFSYHHTARRLDFARPGAHPVTGDNYYRIASITKMFTTTAILQLHAKGKLSLDDPVSKHLSKLSGPIAWDDITLRMLISQSSGLGQDWSQGDLTKGIDDPLEKGFPPPTKKHLTPCYEQVDFFTACNATDLYHAMPDQRPVFSPNQVGSYSNVGFEILGLVIEQVTGHAYETYVEKHILKAWDLTSGVTFDTPADHLAVLPEDWSWFFGVDLGMHSAAGALYATSDGLDKYLRAMMLRAEDPALGAPAVNIFMPESFSFGASSGYGLTWEIFRTSQLLENGRAVTFFTKGGGHPGYQTMILAIPEYGLGITILCAGDKAGNVLGQAREVVTRELVRAADRASAEEIKRKYTGDFAFHQFLQDDSIVEASSEPQKPIVTIDSSLTLAYDSSAGLYIQAWKSNGSDMLNTLNEIFTRYDPDASLTYRLIATNQYLENEHGHRGEIWRGVPLYKRPDTIWGDFCVNNIDGLHFDGKPFLEFVFFEDADLVEIPSFRVKLRRPKRGRIISLQSEGQQLPLGAMLMGEVRRLVETIENA
ncbi:Protein flp [Cyphellophora attinorum]|uniref:Protein flp n=1 Tax=Cyphellophora attinorum TaxID=1664694 RepID=A0A0N1P2V1_9EURO|nr:Protein flp [Phialophora attinorum]KPI44065.1 Protein flp [Phialophora attinorum]